MQDYEQIERLHQVVDDLLGIENHNALARVLSPIDTSKPNEHDTKQEFLLELSAVENSISNLRALIDEFGHKEDDLDREKMRVRLYGCLDAHALETTGRKPVNTFTDLILKNMADTGFTINMLIGMVQLFAGLSVRLKELKDQEREFWSLKHRAPNYHARTIALRLARLYANKKGKKPTFGTAKDGGHPSTDFARAVEQVFEIVGIEADVRGPSEWAIGQLTEEDYFPPSTGLLGGILGINALSGIQPEEKDPKAAIVEALQKGGKP